MVTDPYRPSVGNMAPKDLPFVVEGSEELPPAHGWLCYLWKNVEDSQEETIDGVPEFHLSPYGRTRSLAILASERGTVNPRTFTLCYCGGFGGVVHPGR